MLQLRWLAVNSFILFVLLLFFIIVVTVINFTFIYTFVYRGTGKRDERAQ